jgi:aspartyl-tRNA(Asn)/glutamyl-tRNA(Gln) amidotransferase subunit C
VALFEKRWRNVMANIISDETIEYVGILAKLELSAEDKENAKKDIGEMLDYIDKLNELDTSGVEPMSHAFPVNNVFREDVPKDQDGREKTLSNAPERGGDSFVVPKTI